MDLYMIILRIVHIFSGAYWVGAGLFLMLVLSPTLRSLGQSSTPVLTNMFKHTRFAQLFPLASFLTIVSGLALYDNVSDHFNSDWMSSDSGIVLSIGSLLGILAFLHGSTATGPITNRVGKLLLELDAQSTPPTNEQLGRLRELQMKMARNSRASAMMSWAALIGMSMARYM